MVARAQWLQGGNNRLPFWIAALLAAYYTIVGGMQVLDSSLSLALYLCNLYTLTQTGSILGQIARIILELQTVDPALQRLSELENLPTEFAQRQVLWQHGFEKTKQLAEHMVEQGANLAVVSDNLPILLGDMKLNLLGSKDKDIGGSVKVKQGQLVAFLGPPDEGKEALLKVLGGVEIPEASEGDPGFYMPSHARVLHVSPKPMFVKGTLLENLKYGAKVAEDGELHRVSSICRRLQLDEDILTYLDSAEVQDWSTVLRMPQQQLCMLARALVANPEVVCMDTPVSLLSPDVAKNVMECLQLFVRERGLEQDPEKVHLRNPRTCIFTCTSVRETDFADQVVYVSKAHGICRVLKDGVTPNTFLQLNS